MKSLILMAATMMLSLGAFAQDWRPGPGRPGGPGPGRPWPGDREETRVIRCESNDRRPASCGVGGYILNARVSRQLSSAACNPGNTWGYDRDYIWVQSGCRAEFVVTIRSEGRPGPGPGYPPGPGPGPRPPYADLIRCGSQNYGFNRCGVRAGFIGSVEVERQHSRAACVRGQTYGFDRQSVWVDRGCEATFRVYYR
ncbi:DUF3011 domain-containing protein [Bdellovibrio bacteriovorus]|nr:DUF3011 domain-containing protein [Bdellovibrio bacteriovorus]